MQAIAEGRSARFGFLGLSALVVARQGMVIYPSCSCDIGHIVGQRAWR